MSRLAILLAVLLISPLASAQASTETIFSDWPQPQHDAQGTNTLDGRGIISNPQILWTTSLTHALSARTVEAGGSLVAGTQDENLIFIDKTTGKVISTTPTPGVPLSISIAEGFPEGESRIVVLVEKRGTVWPEPQYSLVALRGNSVAYEIKGCIVGVPSLYRDANGSYLALFGYSPDCLDSSGGVASLNLDSGVLEWITRGSMPVTPPRVGDLELDGLAEVAFVTTSGRVALIDQTGQTRWIHDLNRGVVEAPIIADFDCDGVSDILVPLDPEPWLSLPANVTLYSPTGDVRWSRTFSNGLPPVEIGQVAAGFLRSVSCRDPLVLLSDGTLVAVGGGNGDFLWTRKTQASSLICVDVNDDGLSDAVVVEENDVIGLNGSTGAPLWKVPIEPSLENGLATAAFRQEGSRLVAIVFQNETQIGAVGSRAEAPGLDSFLLVTTVGFAALLVVAAWLVRRHYRRRGRDRGSDLLHP